MAEEEKDWAEEEEGWAGKANRGQKRGGDSRDKQGPAGWGHTVRDQGCEFGC